MHSAQAAVKQRQRVEALCAATIRALTGDRQLHFRGGRLSRGLQRLPLLAPHLDMPVDVEDLDAFRGVADGMALRLAHGDVPLHQSLRPDNSLARMLFGLLEQFRCESLAPPDMPGLVHNLRERHEHWSLALHHGGLTDSAIGLLVYTVMQVCRARVTGQPVVEETEGLIEATRMGLHTSMGTAFAGLRHARNNQLAYAQHALAICHAVLAMVQDARAADGEQQDDADDAEAQGHNPLSQWLQEAGDDEAGTAAAADAARALALADGGYRIFSTAYDAELKAASLVRPALLRDYREQLDSQLAAQRVQLGRLARELKALLATPARDGWDGGQEEGQIDGRSLARLVASPTERRLFRLERQQPQADGVVGFLIDCSGSMRQHAPAVAMLVDVFARALEQAGTSSEVLGFTTGAWNGGRARRDWLRTGRPAQPGRLNEISHLVFKDAGTPWRRARQDIAALLKADLFREGVDGEAVDWACARLMASGARRRLLVVISDGCPMDAATAQANGDSYLERHLAAVVARHEAKGQVGICGVGVGLDLSHAYSNTVALDLSASVTPAVLRDMLALMARGCRSADWWSR